MAGNLNIDISVCGLHYLWWAVALFFNNTYHRNPDSRSAEKIWTSAPNAHFSLVNITHMFLVNILIFHPFTSILLHYDKSLVLNFSSML